MTPPTIGGSSPQSLSWDNPPQTCLEIRFTSDQRLTHHHSRTVLNPLAGTACVKLLLDFTNEMTHCLLSLCFFHIANKSQKTAW